MSTPKPFVIGVGEVLWDVFPTGKRLGGAVANVLYHCARMDMDAGLISRVGHDEFGTEAVRLLEQSGIDISLIQHDTTHSTGRVNIDIEDGDASYVFADSVAWDFIEPTDAARSAICEADFIIFGTLAQRTDASMHAIQSLISSGTSATKVCDINLRQPHVNEQAVRASLEYADVIKLNVDELAFVQSMTGIAGGNSAEESARLFVVAFDCELVCITMGAEGSILADRHNVDSYRPPKTHVVDTVGAGDSFTAAICDHLRRKSDLRTMNQEASALAAWVCTQNGAMPEYDKR